MASTASKPGRTSRRSSIEQHQLPAKRPRAKRPDAAASSQPTSSDDFAVAVSAARGKDRPAAVLDEQFDSSTDEEAPEEAGSASLVQLWSIPMRKQRIFISDSDLDSADEDAEKNSSNSSGQRGKKPDSQQLSEGDDETIDVRSIKRGCLLVVRATPGDSEFDYWLAVAKEAASGQEVLAIWYENTDSGYEQGGVDAIPIGSIAAVLPKRFTMAVNSGPLVRLYPKTIALDTSHCLAIWQELASDWKSPELPRIHAFDLCSFCVITIDDGHDDVRDQPSRRPPPEREAKSPVYIATTPVGSSSSEQQPVDDYLSDLSASPSPSPSPSSDSPLSSPFSSPD